jgi:hypothetical protein
MVFPKIAWPLGTIEKIIGASPNFSLPSSAFCLNEIVTKQKKHHLT